MHKPAVSTLSWRDLLYVAIMAMGSKWVSEAGQSPVRIFPKQSLSHSSALLLRGGSRFQTHYLNSGGHQEISGKAGLFSMHKQEPIGLSTRGAGGRQQGALSFVCHGVGGGWRWVAHWVATDNRPFRQRTGVPWNLESWEVPERPCHPEEVIHEVPNMHVPWVIFLLSCMHVRREPYVTRVPMVWCILDLVLVLPGIWASHFLPLWA